MNFSSNKLKQAKLTLDNVKSIDFQTATSLLQNQKLIHL